MIKNETLHKKVKYLYYEQDMTQKEIAEMLGKSRQWISTILNSDENHKELTKKKKQKRNVERNVEFYNNSKAKILIPVEMLEAIGANKENRKVSIRVEKNKIVIEHIKR